MHSWRGGFSAWDSIKEEKYMDCYKVAVIDGRMDIHNASPFSPFCRVALN